MTPASSPPPKQTGGLARSLLLVLLSVALGPLLLIAILLYQLAQTDITAQVNAHLEAQSVLKQALIEQWIQQRVGDLVNLASAPDVIQAAQALSAGEPADPEFQNRLESFIRNNPDFKSLLIVDVRSAIILQASADGQSMVGQALGEQAFFADAPFRPQFVAPRFDPRLDAEAVSLLASAPVITTDQGTVAVLVGVLHDTPLLRIIAPVTGLGVTGQAYALTQDGYRLGTFITAETQPVESEGIRRALRDHASGLGTYLGPNGWPVVGRYAWLPKYGLALLVEQTTTEAYAPLNRAAWVIGVTTLGATLLALLVGVFFTRRLITPIRDLTETASRIAAGDLEARAEVQRSDELGLLGSVFNQMSDDLQVMYQTLQSSAESRARQLAVTAAMSRIAAASQGLEQLLSQVVDLIRERFGYDHVFVFLLDEHGRNAVLHEGSGPAGAELKLQGFQLPVGNTSIVGWVAQTGTPRIAAEVRSDPLYHHVDLVADTHSEAAFPLRVGDRIIGVLDVQSRQPSAFSGTDLEALQTLSDQIAVAVENNRLFARQQHILQLEELVLALTTKIHQTFNPETILESAALQLGRALGARRAVVRLHPPEGATPDEPPALPPGNGQSNGGP